MAFLSLPEVIAAGAGLDEALEAVWPGAAVFAIWPRQGDPYLGKTGVLRRRLKRLLRQREQPSRMLKLRSMVERVEYWPVGSRLEAALVMYDLARAYLPETYRELLKLRMPSYSKFILSNPFPRLQVTTRLADIGQYYGPFRSRGGAEEFEHQLLDLFQIRRCADDLEPSPDHPGCIYGEMGMCLRPCQEAVGASEYASEVMRVSDFLANGGKAFLRDAQAARDRLSAEMQFEEAARQHKRVERIEQVLKLRDELACDIDRLHGVAVTPSCSAGHVRLWFVLGGAWQPPQSFSTDFVDESLSMDRRLKDAMGSITPVPAGPRERQEHLAMLARWFYSSWRDGEWLSFDSFDRIPYRRLVNAISRTARAML